METNAKPQSKHLGRKISRVREMLGMKQEALADKLGVTQQAISRIEQSENVEDSTLERVATALGMRSEAIRNFNEDAAINLVQNNYEGSNPNSIVAVQNQSCTFNPLEKYVEAMEENKKLYEALLKTEREKISLLERMLEMKK
jgi:transcriptional regulator with XRE-family HTH domain